jgi:hypothetical protein
MKIIPALYGLKGTGDSNTIWKPAGIEQARRVVCMGYGAVWIWNLVAEHFPGAIEIVGFYHASEHLWQVWQALWGDRGCSEQTRGRAHHYRKQARLGRVDLVIAAMNTKAGSLGTSGWRIGKSGRLSHVEKRGSAPSLAGTLYAGKSTNA